MQEFEIGEVLYKGEVAETWTGTHTSSKTEVFVIITNKKKLGHLVDHERIAKLAPIVKDVDSPFILKYHRMVQNENQLGIIMEHPKGQLLRDYLMTKPERKLPEIEARLLFQQLVTGVEHLHGMQIVHRNLNLRNIWINEHKHVKIGDFLVCAKVVPSKPTATFSNAHFYAPEMWADNGGLATFSSDIWTLGVLLYVMVCGVYPFDGKHEFEIFLSVKQAKILIPPNISSECASLLRLLLQVNFELRPSIQAIKQHPWFSGPEVFSDGSASSSPALNRRYLDSIPDESSSLPGSPLPSKFSNLTISSSGEGDSNSFSIDDHTPIVEDDNIGFNEFSPQTNYSNPSPVFPGNGDVHGFIQGMLRRVPSSNGNSFVPAFTPDQNSEISVNQNNSAFTPYANSNHSPQMQMPSSQMQMPSPVVTRGRGGSDSILQSQEIQKLLGITTESNSDDERRKQKETKVKVESSPGATRKAGRRLRRRSFDSQINSPYNRIDLSQAFPTSNTTESQAPPPPTAPNPQFTIPPYNGVRVYQAPISVPIPTQYIPPYFPMNGVQSIPQMPTSRNNTPPSKSPSPTPRPEVTDEQLRYIMQQQMLHRVRQVQMLAQQAAFNSALQSHQVMNHQSPSPSYVSVQPQTPQPPTPQSTPQEVVQSPQESDTGLDIPQDPFSNPALEPIDPTLLQQLEDTSMHKPLEDLNLENDLSAADLGAFISLTQDDQDNYLNSFFN